ncbi:aminopeptidase N [Usitatibacter palustris]|uniref:Aminopeptidase N n=1 Tax=Usitatibacter palustris TaxID=2732487 RepID=A0A6M4H319_9PROT|nr:aminopeptidase N [Usitatibacter palustris]QJR13715.1 Aminopeptidase N [Usitatibacter palustris]
MRDPNPQPVLLKDYAPPPYLIDRVELDVDVREPWATVHARLAVRRNPGSKDTGRTLVLDGEHIELLSVAIDGRALAASEYKVDAQNLRLESVPDAFTLETRVRFDPWKNTRLEGFYATKDGLFTQCEAQGFRCITYFVDRPDVMAKYLVTLHADKERFPRLLANGNLVASGDEEGARHWARWEDPFPKPCYLYAMVAAKLDLLEGSFTTRSGKNALLQVYVEPGKVDQAGFTLHALKKAMQWDESVFGLELDLDRFMIVAVGDFNMGAMENKGLNIFNTKYVLARPDTATDMDYYLIDRVVAHEYFHNWTGNRVTCRDWFQLSLKEGLTVFRDQEYGADEYSRAVARIQDVRKLREVQFAEDAGPMAHPVRPDTYVEINNFYTPTVYDKGAEVVRMIHTIIGKAAFRRGMDLYFERHDGQAVTCDDFVRAMEDAAKVDLTQFRRWYSQSGTPVVACRGEYDATAQKYTLTVKQSCPPTAGQPEKLPFHIPMAVGLVAADGADMALRLEGEPRAQGTNRVLDVREAEQRFVFVDVPSMPVPSLLRGFSAPVVLRSDWSDADLTHLMAYDSDAFNRWEAGDVLATRIILAGVKAIQAGNVPEIPAAYIDAIGRVLVNAARDPAFAAECLALPAESFLAEQMDVADPDAIHVMRKRVIRILATRYRTRFEGAFRHFSVPGAYSPDAGAAGRRALRNAALAYLMELDDSTARALTFLEYRRAENMTDTMAALQCLANSSGAERERALGMFFEKWKDEALVVDKWFRVQATSELAGAIDRVQALLKHPAFTLANPNRARSLLFAFARANPVHFHAADGSGYRFVAEQVVALDALNPQIASGLARSFDRWKKYDAARQGHARAALESIRTRDALSNDVREVVDRALA